MILYWTILALLAIAVALCALGAAAASEAGSLWWLRFHVRAGLAATAAAIAFTMIGAPIALKL